MNDKSEKINEMFINDAANGGKKLNITVPLVRKLVYKVAHNDMMVTEYLKNRTFHTTILNIASESENDDDVFDNMLDDLFICHVLYCDLLDMILNSSELPSEFGDDIVKFFDTLGERYGERGIFTDTELEALDAEEPLTPEQEEVFMKKIRDNVLRMNMKEKIVKSFEQPKETIVEHIRRIHNMKDPNK